MAEKCYKCEAVATWSYLPEGGSYQGLYACETHVPRDCKFCNMDEEGDPLPKKDWQPCCEWWYLGEGGI